MLAVDAAKKTNLETPQEGTVSASISYSGSGGRNHDKNLSITVSLIDDLGNLVFATNIQGFIKGFNDKLINYQLLLP